MAQLFLTEQARTDIAKINTYSIQTWGHRIAEKYITQFESAFDRLRTSPNLLREKAECSGRLLFYAVEKHWLVCDRIDDAVYVLTLKHGSIDLPNRTAELEPQLIEEVELMHRRYLQRKK